MASVCVAHCTFSPPCCTEQHAVEVELQEARLRLAESKQSLQFAQQQVEGLKEQLQEAAQVCVGRRRMCCP